MTNKTQPTHIAPDTFLAAVEPERKREEAVELDALFRRVTGWQPRMWGPSMIGYGQYHYCLLYTSPSPRDLSTSRMPSSA